MRKFIRKIINQLPAWIKYKLYRRQLKASDAEGELIIKLATTKSEYEQAFKLLHEAYVAQGFMKPNESQMRITLYHALPTTITIIAVKGEEVVGTVSIIRNNPLGLPIEDVVDLSKLREKNNDRIAEISSLAIKRGHRGDSGKILFPLTKYMKHMCQDLLKVSEVVIAVNPKMVDFYRSILLFKPTKALSIKNYGFANGAPAEILTLNFEQAYHDNHIVYNNKPENKNLFMYYYSKSKRHTFYQNDNYRVPERSYQTTSYLTMCPDLINYFFVEKSQIFQNLTGNSLHVILNLFSYGKYLNVLPFRQKSRRKDRRHELDCKVRIHLPEGGFAEGRMVRASLNGVYLYTNVLTDLEHEYKVDVCVSEFEVSQITIDPLKGQSSNYMVGQILKSDPVWEKLIAYLESAYSNRAEIQRRIS